MHLVIGAVAAYLLKNPNFRQAVGIWRLKQAVDSWENQRDRQVVVRHRLPGRLRLGVATLAGNQQFAARLDEELAQLDGVRQIQASAVTGGLLVEYDPATVAEATLIDHIIGDRMHIGVQSVFLLLDRKKSGTASSPSYWVWEPESYRRDLRCSPDSKRATYRCLRVSLGQE